MTYLDMDTPTPVTNLVATASGLSPLWLNDLSGYAATALPILGCAWLLLQGGFFLYGIYKKHRNPNS